MADTDPTQARRSASRTWREDVLTEAGFYRRGNTSMFFNLHGDCVLSPGVGPGTNGRYWFDIRDANLRKISGSSARVLLRFVDRGFVLTPLSEFATHLNDRTRRSTSAGGAYGFVSAFESGRVRLQSSSNAGYTFRERLLDAAEVAESLGGLA